MQELRSQLATECADREEVERQLSDRETEIAELRSELSNRETEPAPASKLPDAGDLLNRLIAKHEKSKAKRKKSAVTLADVEMLLELLEG